MLLKVFESFLVLRSTLAQRVAEDFAQSRTVILRGWVLSRGEARLFEVHFLRGEELLGAGLALHGVKFLQQQLFGRLE